MLTVKELIEQLLAFPPDKLVSMATPDDGNFAIKNAELYVDQVLLFTETDEFGPPVSDS